MFTVIGAGVFMTVAAIAAVTDKKGDKAAVVAFFMGLAIMWLLTGG